MTLTEQAIATIIRAGREALLGDHEEFCGGHNYSCACGHDIAKEKALLDALEALDALAQEALQSRREGQQMREALTEAAETWEHLADDLELGDPEDDECHAEELCGEPLCDELGCIIRKRNLARALSHPKPESVK